MHVNVMPGVGPGWRAIAEAAAREVAVSSPGNHVTAIISPDGLMQLRCRPNTRETRRIAARYEAEAQTTCEPCGGTARVRAGVVVRFLCDDCAASMRR